MLPMGCVFGINVVVDNAVYERLEQLPFLSLIKATRPRRRSSSRWGISIEREFSHLNQRMLVQHAKHPLPSSSSLNHCLMVPSFDIDNARLMLNLRVLI